MRMRVTEPGVTGVGREAGRRVIRRFDPVETGAMQIASSTASRSLGEHLIGFDAASLGSCGELASERRGVETMRSFTVRMPANSI